MDGEYIYCGIIHKHFGHCLLSTLCRFWPWIHGVSKSRRIVVHGPHPFNLPFLKFWLIGLGLTQDQFVRVTSPVVFRKILIPEPAFEEQWLAHKNFIEICRRVSAHYNMWETEACSVPVYISKSGLFCGVQNIENEKAIDEEFTKRSIPVVHPESLSPLEQLKVFWRHRVIIGSAGSALHSVAFAPQQTRILAFTMGEVLHANYPLLDLVRGVHATYFNANLLKRSTHSGFSSTFAFRSPLETVERIMELLPGKTD